MEVLDGWITGVFLGSSRHEIIGSVEKKKLQTSYCVIHIKYTNIMWDLGGWRIEHRRFGQDVVLDDFVLCIWIAFVVSVWRKKIL